MKTRKRAVRPASTEGHPQLFPEPRLDTGEALLRRELATACLDISDGLSTDLGHLCVASEVNAEIEQESLPLHPLAHKLGPANALNAALHGGEDYELLFAAPASARMPASLAGITITRIGTLVRRRAGQPLMTIIEPNGRRTALKPGGWEHFSAAKRAH